MKVAYVANAPAKPLMVWDGDCDFCGFWVRWLQRRTRDAVEYEPYQNKRVAELVPEIGREQFETAVQLVLPTGRVLGGAEAIFVALANYGRLRWPYAFYRRVPGAAWLAEAGYRFVASHRTFFSRLTRLIWGSKQA